MNGKIQILGRSLPAWVIAVALIVATAGAAAGTVLSGAVAGQVSTSVSQSLSIDSGSVTGADNAIFTVSDNGTNFSAAAEINNGDQYTIALVLQNGSSQSAVFELTLVGPRDVGLSVAGSAAAGSKVDVRAVRTRATTWKGSIASGNGDLTITVAAADDMDPGYYSINGSIKQVSN